MSTVDVGDQIAQRLPLPLMDLLDRSRRLFCHFEGIQYLIHRQIGRAASLFQRLISAATIVDAQLLKNLCCRQGFPGPVPARFSPWSHSSRPPPQLIPTPFGALVEREVGEDVHAGFEMLAKKLEAVVEYRNSGACPLCSSAA